MLDGLSAEGGGAMLLNLNELVCVAEKEKEKEKANQERKLYDVDRGPNS